MKCLYCISLKLALVWAGLGIKFDIEQSFGTSMLVKVLK